MQKGVVVFCREEGKQCAQRVGAYIVIQSFRFRAWDSAGRESSEVDTGICDENARRVMRLVVAMEKQTRGTRVLVSRLLQRTVTLSNSGPKTSSSDT